MTRRVWGLAILLAVTCLVLIWIQLGTGVGGAMSSAEIGTGLLAVLFGDGAVEEPLEVTRQTIFELRLWRALAAALVGGSLSLSGALLQGLFRNGLAAPSVLGVTAGASLGTAIAILAIGGYLPTWSLVAAHSTFAPVWISGAAFLGALGASAVVAGIASVGGRVSVPTLLLAGVAVTTSISGVLGAIQSLVVGDFEVVRALLAFTFGSLDDRQGYHVAMAGVGLLLAALVIPFVATELDLLAGGEDDARALGVDVGRTKLLALGAAVLAAACAVAAAGQIAFLGLIVPHLVRLGAGTAHGHRGFLPLSILGGGVFLLGTDVCQRLWFGDQGLQPGVVMSLLGGPFFLALLIRARRRGVGAGGW